MTAGLLAFRDVERFITVAGLERDIAGASQIRAMDPAIVEINPRQ
jgi:hypothetical protein